MTDSISAADFFEEATGNPWWSQTAPETRKLAMVAVRRINRLESERDTAIVRREFYFREREKELDVNERLRKKVADLKARILRLAVENRQLKSRSAWLDGERDALIDQKNALAAHVEEVQNTLDHNFTTDAARVRKLREVMVRGPEASLSLHDFSLRVEFAQKHRGSLARLIAEKQAEAMDALAERLKWGVVVDHIKEEATELRRRAEEGS